MPPPARGAGSIQGLRGHADGPTPRVTVRQSGSECRAEAESAPRAISSAVEHLPYKEIVTGSIPVSPISHSKASRPNLTRLQAGFLLTGSLLFLEVVWRRAGGDPELLRAWLEGSFEGDVTGSYFGDAISRRRNLLELGGGGRPEIPYGSRLLVSFDWGIGAPSCATLFITNHPLLPKGSLFAIDECYLAKSTRAGEPDWNAGLGASNLQQAQILQEWIHRWGLEPRELSWIADDACWNRTGHALTIGDEFREGDIPFI